MTVKDIAMDVINSLSPKATIDDVIHALYVHAKFQHGEREIRQKKGFRMRMPGKGSVNG